MNRIYQLPENQVEQYLINLETDLTEMKSAPQRIGSQSVLYSVRSSVNAYDYTTILPTDPQAGSPYGYYTLQVTATSSRKGNFFGDLFVYMYVGTPTTSSRYRPSDYLAAQKAGVTPPWSAKIYDYPSNLADLSTKRWDIVITGDNTQTVYLKYFIVAGGS